jgi:hypothetical protein
MNNENETTQAGPFGPIPKDLAGFQLLCNSNARGGDLLIARGNTVEDAFWDNGSYPILRTDEEGYSPSGNFRVYRRNAQPQHLARCAITSELTPAPDTAPTKARTDDAGKPALAHLPWAAIDALARVQGYGAAKYGDFNNYRKGMEVSRNLSCALRHIRDYLQGEDRDHESGQNPLAHALARIAFVLQNEADGVAIDDRFKKGGAA